MKNLTTGYCCRPTVNVGGYIQAVLDRNLAENISRVLYPNDNVRGFIVMYMSAASFCLHSSQRAFHFFSNPDSMFSIFLIIGLFFLAHY